MFSLSGIPSGKLTVCYGKIVIFNSNRQIIYTWVNCFMGYGKSMRSHENIHHWQWVGFRAER